MINRTLKGGVLIIFCVLVSVHPGGAQTPTPTAQEANALYQAQKWEAAAQAYEALARADPSKAPYWYRLGFSLNSTGKYAQALGAFQKAVEVGRGPQAMLGLAHTYAFLKDKDHAFEWLTKAVENNLPQPRQIANDPNLVFMRDDPRFQKLLALVEQKAQVCMSTPEYRGFDFWVGDWEVFNPTGRQVGTNRVVLRQEGCIVEENWTSAAGNTGQSFNFYNPITRKWHQSYMDSNASNWMMDGELKGDALRYEGAIFSPGSKVLVKMTFTKLGPDKVRQTAETSSDEGRTWTSVWDGLYVRKK